VDSVGLKGDNSRDALVLVTPDASLATSTAHGRRVAMTDHESTPSPRMKLSSFELSCAHCRGAFRSRFRKTQFCSPKCRYKNRAGIGLDGMRHRTCRQCEQPFSYVFSRGMDRWYCSDRCSAARHKSHGMTLPMCVVPGCQNRRGSYKAGICNSCFWRLKRTGTLERREWAYRVMSSHGYIVLSNKTHPMTNATGVVYEHRMALYDAIGPGPHPCHWCGRSVNWNKGKCVTGTLVVDHLNGVKTDNSRANLVAACNRCNSKRGLFMTWVTEHKDDPWLWQMYVASKGA
jgi:hypothetical protein